MNEPGGPPHRTTTQLKTPVRARWRWAQPSCRPTSRFTRPSPRVTSARRFPGTPTDLCCSRLFFSPSNLCLFQLFIRSLPPLSRAAQRESNPRSELVANRRPWRSRRSRRLNWKIWSSARSRRDTFVRVFIGWVWWRGDRGLRFCCISLFLFVFWWFVLVWAQV